MKISVIVAIVLAACCSVGAPSSAGDLTPAESKSFRQAVKAYIQEQPEEGAFVVRDEKLDKEWRLKLVRLHDEVRALSDKLFSVCADFKAVGGGTKLDVDFLVNRVGAGWEVRQVVIHAVGGKSRTAQAASAPPLKRLETAAGVFVCPMGDYSGPKTRNGRCPKCGMELIEKK